jgi:pyruvate kinase
MSACAKLRIVSCDLLAAARRFEAKVGLIGQSFNQRKTGISDYCTRLPSAVAYLSKATCSLIMGCGGSVSVPSPRLASSCDLADQHDDSFASALPIITTPPTPGINRDSPVSKRTKILATLGPACSSPEMIRQLWAAGVDMYRINFSHGTFDDHRKSYRTVRQVSRDVSRHIGVCADLQGPKLRVGNFNPDTFPNGVDLTVGMSFRFDLSSELGDATRVELPHQEIFDAMEVGDVLMINDGLIQVRVTETDATSPRSFFQTEVVRPGRISNHKGVNVPDRELPIPALTVKDRADLVFAVKDLGVDWVLLSFVQRPDDVFQARKLIDEAMAARKTKTGVSRTVRLMAKIEKRQAVESLAAICRAADGIMVARGDLGVEMPLHQVPQLQRQIIKAARRAGKPVVVATQMLESCINSPVPTRAEVSDVATATSDGADAVMLSAESSVGKYPLETVQHMSSIIRAAEADSEYYDRLAIVTDESVGRREDHADAIAAAVVKVAEALPAVKAIVCYSHYGGTALRIARTRPRAPILVLTPHLSTARCLQCVWGIDAVHGVEAKSFCSMVNLSHAACRATGIAVQGDFIVCAASLPFDVRTSGANLLHLSQIPAAGMSYTTYTGRGKDGHMESISVLSETPAITPTHSSLNIPTLPGVSEMDELLGGDADVGLLAEDSQPEDGDGSPKARIDAETHALCPPPCTTARGLGSRSHTLTTADLPFDALPISRIPSIHSMPQSEMPTPETSQADGL